MENPRPEGENIIKDTKIDTTIKDIRNFFRLEKENKAIKDIILRDIRNLCENEEEELYCKPVRISNFWSNNYIEYESNGDINKTLSVKIKIIPYLKDIINNLKKYDL